MTLTFLVDLDDTLLGNGMDTFIPAYIEGLANRLSVHVNPDVLVRSLLAATKQVMTNQRPDCTLMNVFDSVFFPMLGIRKEDVQEVINSFYIEDYPRLKNITQIRPEAKTLIDEAFNRGYRVGIATNPLFPLNAITQRLEWAGIPVESYEYSNVPSLETYHFTKPNPAYFAEFLGQVGWPEGPVVMIGNDQEHDIIAAQEMGIKAFWISQNGDKPWEGSEPIPPHGGLIDVFPWIDTISSSDLNPDFSILTAVIAILRATPASLFSLSQIHSKEFWRKRPGSVEWSLTEIVCHLRDVEREVNLPRIHSILRGDNPFIPGQDPDPWAVKRQYNRQDGIQALYAFNAARMTLISILDNLDLEAWEKPARHAIFGPTNLRELVNIITGHDRLHVQQFKNTITSQSLEVL
jgi:FMN phosphatase YigB (HAD superfamily)